jgi:hypothetical protein
MNLSRAIPRPLRPAPWWWFAAAVALHVLAWSAWFTIAAHHPVAEVPLARAAGR